MKFNHGVLEAIDLSDMAEKLDKLSADGWEAVSAYASEIEVPVITGSAQAAKGKKIKHFVLIRRPVKEHEMNLAQCRIAAKKIDDELMEPICPKIESDRQGKFLSHLRYMVACIHDPAMTENKAMRWLGYLQGMLVGCYGQSLESMKKYNMDAVEQCEPISDGEAAWIVRKSVEPVIDDDYPADYYYDVLCPDGVWRGVVAVGPNDARATIQEQWKEEHPDAPLSSASAEIEPLRSQLASARAALQKVADLVDSEAGEPLDEAISIANRALSDAASKS